MADSRKVAILCNICAVTVRELVFFTSVFTVCVYFLQLVFALLRSFDTSIFLFFLYNIATSLHTYDRRIKLRLV